MSTDLGYRACGQLPTDGDREFRCDCCRARCTQSPTKPDIEYGHLSGCPNRPDEFPDIHGRQYRPTAQPHQKLVTDGGDDTDDDAHARRIAEQLAMADDEETEGDE